MADNEFFKDPLFIEFSNNAKFKQDDETLTNLNYTDLSDLISDEVRKLRKYNKFDVIVKLNDIYASVDNKNSKIIYQDLISSIIFELNGFKNLSIKSQMKMLMNLYKMYYPQQYNYLINNGYDKEDEKRIGDVICLIDKAGKYTKKIKAPDGNTILLEKGTKNIIKIDEPDYDIEPKRDSFVVRSMNQTQQIQPMNQTQQIQPMNQTQQIQPMNQTQQIQPMNQTQQIQPMNQTQQINNFDVMNIPLYEVIDEQQINKRELKFDDEPITVSRLNIFNKEYLNTIVSNCKFKKSNNLSGGSLFSPQVINLNNDLCIGGLVETELNKRLALKNLIKFVAISMFIIMVCTIVIITIIKNKYYIKHEEIQD